MSLRLLGGSNQRTNAQAHPGMCSRSAPGTSSHTCGSHSEQAQMPIDMCGLGAWLRRCHQHQWLHVAPCRLKFKRPSRVRHRTLERGSLVLAIGSPGDVLAPSSCAYSLPIDMCGPTRAQRSRVLSIGSRDVLSIGSKVLASSQPTSRLLYR